MIIPVTPQLFEETDMTELGQGFYGEAALPGGFDLNQWRHHWRILLQHDIGAMWFLKLEGKVVGSLGAILAPDINDGQIRATEMFWYVLPQYRKGSWGLRLLFKFEAWAKEMGATQMVMVHLLASLPERLKALYESRGYRQLEVTYIKAV